MPRGLVGDPLEEVGQCRPARVRERGRTGQIGPPGSGIPVGGAIDRDAQDVAARLVQ